MDYQKLNQQLKEGLRIDKSFDIVAREFYIAEHRATLFFIDGFVKDEIMEKIMEFLMKLKKDNIAQFQDFQASAIPYVEVEMIFDKETAITQVLSGSVAFIYEKLEGIVLIDARTYPTRGMNEPDDDRVLRGSRDGFVETLVFNTALIRRRIRDPQLTMHYMQIGKRSKTDIVIAYMEDKVNQKTLQILFSKLKSININSLTLSQESLAECLMPRHWLNPFPKVRYTERPDNASANILEGKIVIIVDNSPSIILLPTSFFDFIQDTNDYYFPPFVGSYLRLVRGIVVLLTLFMTPLWFLMIKNPDLFPSWMHFLLIEEMNDVPIFIQLLIVEFMIDAIKLASLNTPNALSGSFSVVGALILGEFAVKAHWFVPEVLLYMSFVSIANFAQPSYEMGYAFKAFRILFLISILCFDWIGFVIAITFMIIVLLNTKTITGKSYMYPLLPFNGRHLLQLILREPIKKDNN